MTTATAVELVRLSDLRPPPQHVVKVDRGHPIEAFLEDGTPVRLTCILERTAVFERPGREISVDGRESVRKEWVRVDPSRLTWERERARRGGRMKVHRCHTCGRTGGQTKFADPDALNCLNCEGRS